MDGTWKRPCVNSIDKVTRCGLWILFLLRTLLSVLRNKEERRERRRKRKRKEGLRNWRDNAIVIPTKEKGRG